MSRYERFVADNRLALVPTIEGLDASLKRWDTLRIQSLRAPVGTGSSVPPLFAMLNCMKADFIVARQLVFKATTKVANDPGLYYDTLDYARYGATPSMLMLAQRSFLDILDRMAVATNEYLGIGMDSRKVNFRNLWTDSAQPLRWHPRVAQEIGRGNAAVLALGELAEDLKGPGYLAPAQASRNATTHRFVVVHDIGIGEHRPSAAVEHLPLDEYRKATIETARFVRAALLYFVELVARREAREKRGPTLPLFVPTHHYVRGEE